MTPQPGIELIVGPPNSGREGELLGRLRERLDADPILVVPTGDEVARFERELAAGGATIGVTIRTLASLTEQLAGELVLDLGPLLSPAQRLALIRAAIAATPLRLLAASSRARGFAGALDRLVAELQAARVTPERLGRRAAELDPAGAETELAALYGGYEQVRLQAAHSDAGSIGEAVVAALVGGAEPWPGRPLFLYGFDDLTPVQLALVTELARTRAVTMAVNYEDATALSPRAALLTELAERGATVAARVGFDPRYAQSPALAHLSRNLFETDAGTVATDSGIELIEAAGERGEAEAVGLEIARLLDAGAEPGEIVIVVRRPDAQAAIIAAVLREMEIPVAAEGSVELERTAVGRGLITLCAAAAEAAGPDALIAHLRSDPAFPPQAIDEAERRVLRDETRTLDEVYAKWQSPPHHLARLRGADGDTARLRALAASARELAEATHRGAAPLVSRSQAGVTGDRDGDASRRADPVELRAGVIAAELLGELAALSELPGCTTPDLDEAAAAIAAAPVPTWRGSTAGRIRIISPYRARAARATYLFCCGMQEGAFPAGSPSDPLLGDRSRAELDLPELGRGAQADEERYLFHACVSRPTRRLYLSWRRSDEDGSPLPRSPFVDEVLDLLDPEPAVRSQGLAAVVPEPGQAPTVRLLARSLAVGVGSDRSVPPGLELGDEAAAELAGLLAAIPDPAALPGPLSDPHLLGLLDDRRVLSAGQLESWLECSYRWFANHELHPERLEPTPDPLWNGAVVHTALERLYRDPPGDDSIPRPADVGRWQRRFAELLDEAVRESDDPVPGTARRIALARLRHQVDAFLAEEAALETDLRPARDRLEQPFGFPDDEDDAGTLELGELTLRGFVDRIDMTPDGRSALVRDYKSSSKVPSAKEIGEKGKLQLQVYMLVARDLLGLEPIGGLYQPLGATKSGDRVPRGIVVDDERLEGIRTVRTDRVSAEELDERLDAAREQITNQGQLLRQGRITRNPIGGRCPPYCHFQPICRIERAEGIEGAE